MRTSGLWTLRRPDWTGISFQLSWPEFIFLRNEHYLGLHTCIRLFFDRKHGEYAVGFRVLGFGIAFQYFRPTALDTDAK